MSQATLDTDGAVRSKLSLHAGEALSVAPVASTGGRYQMLDVWRGLVCLLVVLEHAGVALWAGQDEGSGVEGWLRGWVVWALTRNIGTALFFVMSGYCIASSLESSRRKGLSPIRFLARRFWRIFPTYWVALLGFVVLIAGLEAFGLTRFRQHAMALEITSPYDLTRAQWLGNLTLTETWRPHLGGGDSSVFTRVAWSLCFQEQFYVICCLALWLTPGRIYRTLAAATLGLAVYRVFIWDSGGTQTIEGTFLYSWHEFAVGLAVYWRLNAGASAKPEARRGVELWVALIALVGLAYNYRSTAAAGSFGLLLIALHRWDAAAGRAAWLEPLRACGRRSYGIYLTHLPVTVVGNALLFDLGLRSYWVRGFVMIPVVIAASLVVGWVFHKYVERRFMSAPPSFATILPRHLRRRGRWTEGSPAMAKAA